MELTKDQKKAYELMASGENVFLTGEAGTGKSFLLNEFIKDNQDKNILITAPTGIAAIEIDGATLHRTFNIPVKDLYKVHKGPRRANKAIMAADILVIDEISMCRLDVFEYVLKSIEQANKERHKDDACQIILVGDFLQLPPILSKDEIGIYKELYGHEQVFPFFSPMWNKFKFKIVELKEVVRQQGDDTLIQNLNKARRGDHSCITYFNKFVTPYKNLNNNAIFICPTNRAASEINKQKIDELEGSSQTYISEVTGEVKYSDKPTEDELELKVGARIMTLINNTEEGYSNGSMGTCIGLLIDGIIAEMDNGAVVKINRHEWEVKEYETVKGKNKEGKVEEKVKLKKIGSFEQLPIKIAFAITTHKSQGQTFDSVVIDPYAWDSGQLYVALSRVKSADGLQLSKAIRDNYLIANNNVLSFYDQDIEKNLQEEVKKQLDTESNEATKDEELIPIKLKTMYFPENHAGILHEVSDAIMSNDKERFLEIANKIWK